MRPPVIEKLLHFQPFFKRTIKLRPWKSLTFVMSRIQWKENLLILKFKVHSFPSPCTWLFHEPEHTALRATNTNSAFSSGSVNEPDNVFSAIKKRLRKFRLFIGWLGAMSTGVALLVSPVTIAFCRRKSTRLTAVLGGLVTALGCLFTSFASQFHQLFFSYGTVVGESL